jgi:adenylosuccinate lyase
MPKPDREADRVMYQSPLSQRYASPAMQTLFGERRRVGLWRRLWLALMEAQRELGLEIPDQAVQELAAHLDDVDLDRAAEHEKRLRHDVMAHIHQLGEQAPAARPFIHLGATSAYVTDNADLILMREGMVLLLGRVAAVLVALGTAARRHRALPCLAYTHFQPAQLTTLGKRLTMWMQDFLLDAEELLHRLEMLQFRGVKGTTGTQASFVELFDGNEQRARELDARVAEKMGFARVFPITGQTYTRKVDAQILAVLSGVAASAAKFATDLRLLQHEGEVLEPFESDQVGSSAMAYKRNPMRAERMTGLARFVIELEGNAWHTAAEQWLERTLDDSANRRLVIPDAFLTSDAILILATNVAAGLEVREAVIARHVLLHMPFLATERLLMRGVKAGGDRQRLHEVIRTHALVAAQAAAEQGAPNDLLERLAGDPAFMALRAALGTSELDPGAYVGRAPQQVDEFLDQVVPPVLARIQAVAPAAAPAEVTV